MGNALHAEVAVGALEQGKRIYQEKPLATSLHEGRRVLAAARANRPCSPDFGDGYRSLAVIEAAEESARTGRVVSLPDLGEQVFSR